MSDYDVIVVGAGNAALAASVSAREQGAEKVLVLEKAPQELRGGNTYFSGGLFRFAYDRPEDLKQVVPSVESDVPGFIEGVEAYPRAMFEEDLQRVTDGRTDPDLSRTLIDNSFDTVQWVRDQGIEMEAAVSLSAIKVGNKIKWPSGAVIRAKHEGVGLSESWFRIAEERGVEIRYRSEAVELVEDGGRVRGLVVRGENGTETIRAKAVVLGAGGFESNTEWRARYLGKPWDHAKVRGTAFNNGDGLRMGIAAGAITHGQWTGCHATPIDAGAPAYGARHLTDRTNRLSYPYGVMVNRDGLRFADEGEDFQFYTYAKMGGIILNQPGGVAWQIFDARTVHLLEPRYETGTPIEADSLEALVAKLSLDRETCMRTLSAYNAAAGNPGDFNPGIRDGVAAKGLTPPKSNWAVPLDQGPFVAYAVTGGITFTFGGLRIDTEARVLDAAFEPIRGLFCCGEMVGGLFHNNYPGGTGLMSGAVFGRIAGRNAAAA